MPEEYTKEELWKLYEKLPQELKEAVFSNENAENILQICNRNGVNDDRISEITKYIGRVLMGVLPPDELRETLEKKLKLDKEMAKRISQEINRFIFYPVKANLEELYKIEIAPIAGTPVKPPSRRKITEELEEKPRKKDIYREPVA